MKHLPKIVLLGAGNVGFHLVKKLNEVDVDVLQVFSRKISKAKRLAKFCNQSNRRAGSTFTKNIEEISTEADLYILAVPDRVIGNVAAELSSIISQKKLVVHTSGATPSTVLKPHFKNYGIFYPLQSFSINKEVDFENIPICVDSNLKKHRLMLEKLGNRISRNVHHINDKERAILHVAAVFVNNFSNNLFTIAEQITEKEGLPLSILEPLIQETVNKIIDHSPSQMQTGPAKRGDLNTIHQHLEYLEKNFPELVKVYRTMTQNINPNIL